MSERGSFCTSYIYCPHCFDAAKAVLIDDDKYLYSMSLPHANGEEFHIIAGKIGGTASDDELRLMEELCDALTDKVCHPLYVSVLPESGNNRVFKVTPNNKVK